MQSLIMCNGAIAPSEPMDRDPIEQRRVKHKGVICKFLQDGGGRV
jgi:hypothetical protein